MWRSNEVVKDVMVKRNGQQWVVNEVVKDEWSNEVVKYGWSDEVVKDVVVTTWDLNWSCIWWSNVMFE